MKNQSKSNNKYEERSQMKDGIIKFWISLRCYSHSLERKL
jgi:hypothetical protein